MSFQLSTALAIASNALGAGDLTEEKLPAGARLALEGRARALDEALASPRIDRVRSIIAGLGTMPARAEDDPATQRFVLEQYVAICSDVPEWALEWAAWAFLKNETGTMFRPSGGELRTFAMRRVTSLIAERQKIDAVLRAKLAPPTKPIDGEQRKRLGDMLRKVAADFQDRDSDPLGRPREREKTPAEHLAHLESLRALYVGNPLGNGEDESHAS